MPHSVVSVAKIGPSSPGALGGYQATCSCGYKMSSSLGEREARNLGYGHVNYMNAKEGKK